MDCDLGDVTFKERWWVGNPFHRSISFGPRVNYQSYRTELNVPPTLTEDRGVLTQVKLIISVYQYIYHGFYISNTGYSAINSPLVKERSNVQYENKTPNTAATGW